MFWVAMKWNFEILAMCHRIYKKITPCYVYKIGVRPTIYDVYKSVFVMDWSFFEMVYLRVLYSMSSTNQLMLSKPWSYCLGLQAVLL